MKTSRVSKFYERSIGERIEFVKDFACLSEAEVSMLKSGLRPEDADKMIENAIGTFSLPLGIVVNFLINGKDYIIPMAIEEPSVIAAASNAAKIARESGGFSASADDSIMIGQIYLFDTQGPGYQGTRVPIADINFPYIQLSKSPSPQVPKSPVNVVQHILSKKQELLALANSTNPKLIEHGGGAKDMDVEVIAPPTSNPQPPTQFIRVHLYVDCRDAMGANIVNTMCEAIAPRIIEAVGGRAVLKILSNLADRRLARAECTFKKEILGEELIDSILKAQLAAEKDQYRAATHNKGIMNAISAICVATGNDWRAVEAGAHSYAGGKPLTKYELLSNGDLKASIELPLAVATVGGSTKHPQAQVNLKILGVKTSQELAQVMAAAGLAQNFAALRALVTEGIQKGHMKLHEKKSSIVST